MASVLLCNVYCPAWAGAYAVRLGKVLLVHCKAHEAGGGVIQYFAAGRGIAEGFVERHHLIELHFVLVLYNNAHVIVMHYAGLFKVVYANIRLQIAERFHYVRNGAVRLVLGNGGLLYFKGNDVVHGVFRANAGEVYNASGKLGRAVREQVAPVEYAGLFRSLQAVYGFVDFAYGVYAEFLLDICERAVIRRYNIVTVAGMGNACLPRRAYAGVNNAYEYGPLGPERHNVPKRSGSLFHVEFGYNMAQIIYLQLRINRFAHAVHCAAAANAEVCLHNYTGFHNPVSLSSTVLFFNYGYLIIAEILPRIEYMGQEFFGKAALVKAKRYRGRGAAVIKYRLAFGHEAKGLMIQHVTVKQRFAVFNYCNVCHVAVYYASGTNQPAGTAVVW